MSYAWYLCKEKDNGYSVRRRTHDGKHERLPRAKYKHLLKDHEELVKYVDRLNGRDRRALEAKEAYKALAAFCDTRLVERFDTALRAEVPTEKEANQLISALKRYVLHYFIVELQKPDPLEWRKYQAEWGVWLTVAQELKRGTLRRVRQVANRYLAYLHEQFPQEYPLTTLRPVSRQKEKLLFQDDEEVGEFIKPEDWSTILNQAQALGFGAILPAARLAYAYGLRRAEALALEQIDVRNAHIHLARQQLSASRTGPLKDRETRKTPHWFITAAQAHHLIGCIQKMHPDMFGQAWSALMLKLEFTYTLHDLRRTFITRALREQKPVDVQHAVGHSSIATTMKYQMDDRNLDDAPFIA